jgi:hypothetical protein
MNVTAVGIYIYNNQWVSDLFPDNEQRSSLGHAS